MPMLHSRRSRPRGTGDPPIPRWMGTIESFNVGKAFAVGLFLGALNPKNIPLTIAAAAAIAGTGISNGSQAVALLVFAAVGTIGVAAPLAIYFPMGDRARHLLDDLRQWRRRGGRRARRVRGLVGAVHARRRPVGCARRRPRARSAHGIARALQGEAAGATVRSLGEGLGGARRGLTPTR
jgi:threonine/homoserine/homoserine lactone efflux protein